MTLSSVARNLARAEHIVPRLAGNVGLDTFRRYRATRNARGTKPIRVRVPDPHTHGFREELAG